MKQRAPTVSVSWLWALFVTVAAVAVLVGCGDAGERAAELPAGSGEQSGAVLYDAEDAAAGDAGVADVNDVDLGEVAADGGTVGDGVDDAGEVVDGDAGVADVNDVDLGGVGVGGGAVGDGVGGDAVEVVGGDAGVANVNDADLGGVGVGGGTAADGVWGDAADVVDGAVGDAGAGDAGDVGGGEVDADVGLETARGNGGIEVVDDGVGGLLVLGVCGWPGPLCVADEGVAPIDEGGRLWWRSRSSWETLVGRVLDMCDDHEALAAIDGEYWTGYGRGIDYGAEIGQWNMGRVIEEREFYPIVCSEAEASVPRWKCWDGDFSVLRTYLEGFEQPPEYEEVLAWIKAKELDCFDAAAERRRYVYVAADGPLWPVASVEAAVETYQSAVARWGGGAWSSRGDALGYEGWEYLLESPVDELIVRLESVSVIDGVVRGLAQNHSERLWARNVAVIATDPDGAEGVWRFPLTVQPGEMMPFEIEGWNGSQLPSEISFEVSADLSPRIDLTRSLLLTEFKRFVSREEMLAAFPQEMIAGEIPDGYFDFVEVHIEREASTAHPRLAEAAVKQTIENLVVYGATFNAGAVVVLDVFELTPVAKVYSPDSEVQWVEVSGLPAELPSGSLTGEAIVGTILKENNPPHIWAGGSSD